MKTLTTALILVGSLSAHAQPAKPAADDASVAATLIQIAHDWGDAEIAGNADYLAQVLADDWVEVGGDGKHVTKQPFLAWVRSGKAKSGTFKMTACEHGPFDVKVFGDVAVMQGSATETLVADDGRRKIVRAAYMDVFVKQGGKWVVVCSQDTKL